MLTGVRREAMKAIILAAGKGTRMGSLTEETPKPMLRVEGKPILEHILGGLRQAGIVDICLITGWKAEVIEQHLGDGSALGVNLQYRQQTLQTCGPRSSAARDFVGKMIFCSPTATFLCVLRPTIRWFSVLAQLHSMVC